MVVGRCDKAVGFCREPPTNEKLERVLAAVRAEKHLLETLRIQRSAETAEVRDLGSQRGQNHLNRLIRYFAGYLIDPEGKCMHNQSTSYKHMVHTFRESSVVQSLCEEHHEQVCILRGGRFDICLPDLLQRASLPPAH